MHDKNQTLLVSARPLHSLHYYKDCQKKASQFSLTIRLTAKENILACYPEALPVPPKVGRDLWIAV
jgi:hypothetical protein